MSLMTVIAGAELLLLVVNLVMIRKNEMLLKEIRRCNDDLALVLFTRKTSGLIGRLAWAWL